jgi:putative membrane protein
METPSEGQPAADVRDYLAEERTFVAGIRTVLGAMGFGFLMARVDRFSLWFGTTLIAVGAALSLLNIQRLFGG